LLFGPPVYYYTPYILPKKKLRPQIFEAQFCSTGPEPGLYMGIHTWGDFMKVRKTQEEGG
jgi:hypothetical protein